MPRVAQSFRQAREKRGLSLNTLEQRSGISRQSISKIEEGKRNSGVYTLAQVAKEGMGIPLWKLIKEAEENL